MNRSLAFVLSIGLLSCGREIVDLGPAMDGGALMDASAECGDGTCRPNGGECSSPDECCSGRCESHVCLAPGTCAPPGASCANRSLCCGGRCDMKSRTSSACESYCAPNRARCATAAQCCSLSCTDGRCGGALCGVVGQSCSNDAECCSNSCDQNQCRDSDRSCRTAGDACDSDGGMICCSGVCNDLTRRCDFGPGPCREPDAPCITDGDCCRGQCLPNAQGDKACTAPCLEEGRDCNGAGDCCSSRCEGNPSKCRAACASVAR